MGDLEDPRDRVLATGALLKESWRVYRENFAPLILIGLILLTVSVLFQYIFDGSPISLIPVDFVTSAWLVGAVALVVQASYASKQGVRSAPHFLGEVWPRLVWLVLLYAATEILIALATVALIVPGVILSLLWFVAIPVMMVEGLGVFDSMARSSDLTRGRRKKILWVVLISLGTDAVFAGFGFLIRDLDPAIKAVWNLGTGVLLSTFFAVVFTVVYFRLVSLVGPRAAPAAPDVHVNNDESKPPYYEPGAIP